MLCISPVFISVVAPFRFQVLHQSLQKLLTMEDSELIDQTFNVASVTPWGDVVSHDLVPNGGDLEVNNGNRHGVFLLHSKTHFYTHASALSTST